MEREEWRMKLEVGSWKFEVGNLKREE